MYCIHACMELQQTVSHYNIDSEVEELIQLLTYINTQSLVPITGWYITAEQTSGRYNVHINSTTQFDDHGTVPNCIETSSCCLIKYHTSIRVVPHSSCCTSRFFSSTAGSEISVTGYFRRGWIALPNFSDSNNRAIFERITIT